MHNYYTCSFVKIDNIIFFLSHTGTVGRHDSKMVQFSFRACPTDVEVDVRRNGDFDGTKYVPNTMSVRNLVMCLANGASKAFLNTNIVQDISFMSPGCLDREVGSYNMGVLGMDFAECADTENHQCVLNHLNMCMSEPEEVVDLTGDSSDEETATTEEYGQDEQDEQDEENEDEESEPPSLISASENEEDDGYYTDTTVEVSV